MVAPFIVFDNNGEFVVQYKSWDRIREASASGLRGDPFHGMRIVDTDLTLYTVKEVGRVRGRGCLFGYNLWFNRDVIVDLVLDPRVRKIDLQELKDMILARLSHDNIREFYDEDVQGFLRKIELSDSFEDLAELIPVVG